MLKKYSKKTISWAFYDWANSAFATTMMAAALPIYYSMVAAGNLPKVRASIFWGYTNTVAMLIFAVFAPILGAIADYSERRIFYLKYFMFSGVLATGAMIFIGRGDWIAASILYIIGHIGFSGSCVFYNSLLPFVSTKTEMDRVSAFGYAIGYLGGGLLLGINLLMIMKPSIFGIPNPEWGFRLSFFSVALWWVIFSIPILVYVQEPKVNKKDANKENVIRSGFKQIKITFREIRKYRQILRFLIAYWLYNDGIGTIIVMATIFGTEIGIGQNHLIGALLMVQFVGIPFTVFFGKIAGFFGTKKTILFGLGVYTLITIFGYFMKTALHFWILATLVAFVQGGTQALSRSFFCNMIPMEKTAEFFGFYDISSKFSSILGPLVFAFTAQLFGSSRAGIFGLIIFFITGGLTLLSVKETSGIN